MKKSLVIVLAVAILATTAGCAGVLDGGSTDTGDGADGAAAEGETAVNETDRTIDYPDGTGETGFDADELASRQAAILEDGSYTVDTSETISTDARTFEESIALAVDGERKVQKTRLRHESSTEETWLFTESANETLVRQTFDGGDRYRIANGPTAPSTNERSIRRELEAVLRVSEYDLIDIEESDGTTVVTYEGTEMSDALERMNPADEYDEFVATVSVSDDGIERYAYELEGTSAGATETIAVETSFSSVGETELERPEWVDEGFEKAPEVSISTDGGEIIELAMEAGDPIPEGSTVSLSAIGENYRGASLDEAFEPGETLSLSVRDGRLRAGVDADPDAGDPIDTEWFTVTLRTENLLTAYEGTYEETTE
ncbi:hypothetical protein [Natrialba sp. PRR66]|uniref:DUF7537 family lipoprotein n=1 Tax=Natrialba sp. PRR66 TaxID=3098146 RepID=UPI002B1DD87D|nr:hypothetical protein [Natrialba sp. PRR66]